MPKKILMRELKSDLHRYITKYLCKSDVHYSSKGISIFEYLLIFNIDKAILTVTSTSIFGASASWQPKSFNINNPNVMRDAFYCVIDRIYCDQLIYGKGLYFETIEYIRSRLC